jgi:hypothetical protein
MTVGLAAALAVALVAVVVLALALVSSSRNLGKERRRGDDATRRLQDARNDLESVRAEVDDNAERARRSDELATQAVGDRDDALRGAAAADERAAIAEERATSAEQRATSAEQQVSAREEFPGEARSDLTGGALWRLERVRAEREWTDVVGAGVELPVGWHDTIAAVVSIELEIIREVIGTPATLQDRSGPVDVSPVAARLSIELVRRMARIGEEMNVAVESDRMSISYDTAESAPPDLAELSDAARRAGGDLSVSHVGTEATVSLVYPR